MTKSPHTNTVLFVASFILGCIVLNKVGIGTYLLTAAWVSAFGAYCYSIGWDTRRDN